MIIGIFVTVAVILVAFGGLLAAADAALSVLSRSDLVELATTSRSRRSLIGIAKDVGAHVNAINFMRVVSETTTVRLGGNGNGRPSSAAACSTRRAPRTIPGQTWPP